MALSDNNVIGVGKKLPWRIPFDLKWFKMNTYGQVCIMGRKTWESLPAPLDNRLNIVLSRKKQTAKGCIFCQHLKDAIQLGQEYSPNIYVIGGSDIFIQTLLLKNIDSIIITRVHATITDNKAVYTQLPLYKTLKWKSSLFEYKKIPFHFEIYTLD